MNKPNETDRYNQLSRKKYQNRPHTVTCRIIKIKEKLVFSSVKIFAKTYGIEERTLSRTAY